jgi:hypothetical protein
MFAEIMAGRNRAASLTVEMVQRIPSQKDPSHRGNRGVSKPAVMRQPNRSPNKVGCMPRFEPSNGDQLVEAVRGLSRPDVPPFARICKTFRNKRPRSASTGSQAGEPTPIFRGRLRCAVIASCLSRRRPRVRVPSTPPTPSLRSVLGVVDVLRQPAKAIALARKRESRRPRQLPASQLLTLFRSHLRPTADSRRSFCQ